MLSIQDNDRLTQVGPGTDCGAWLRSFWFPIAISERWDGPRAQLQLPDLMRYDDRTGTPTEFGEKYGTFLGDPLKIRLLGEDLVLYRDLSDTLGLVGLNCPHRSTSLEYGRPRERGLACSYHGWTFDETGRCLAMPGEPETSAFKEKVSHLAYPVEERGGLIWAYLGSGEPPQIPPIDVFAANDGIRIVENFCIWPAHWLQVVENSVDQVHTGILHGEGSSRADVWSQVPEVDWNEDVNGIQTIQIRGDYGRTNYLHFPTTILLNQPWPGGKFSWPRYSAIVRTPVDDHHTLFFHVTYVPPVNGRLPDLPDGMELEAANQVQTLFIQDYRAIVTQGASVDRSIERLGTTDRGIIMLRKKVERGIDAVKRGEDPEGVVRNLPDGHVISSSAKITDGMMSPSAAE